MNCTDGLGQLSTDLPKCLASSSVFENVNARGPPQASCTAASRGRFDRKSKRRLELMFRRSAEVWPLGGGHVKSLRGGVGLTVLNYLAGKCRTFRIDCNGGGRGPATRATVRVGETKTNQAGLWETFTSQLGSAGPESKRVGHDSFGTGQKTGKSHASKHLLPK